MRQGLESLFRTVTFRLAALQTGVVLVFVLGLLAYVYISTIGQFQGDADQAAAAEYRSLERVYAEGGVTRLRDEVIERSARQSDMLYLLIDASGARLHSDVTETPSLPGAEIAPIDRPFTRRLPNEQTAAVRGRGQIGRLLGGPVLMVVRDFGEAAELFGRITNALFFTALIGVAFAMVSGAVASGQAANKAAALAATAQGVMEGDLALRAPHGDGRDEFDGLAKSLNDMLEKVERLVHTTRTAGDSIAHDLRSPLTRLKHRLEAALAADPGSDKERNALRKAVEETDRLLETFSAVLKVSRVESVSNWRFKDMDVSAVVREMAEFYEPGAEEAGLALACNVEDGLTLHGEPQLIAQALANLIENAVKYTPSGGRVEVRAARRVDGRMEIAVLDDGPGVPAAERDRVTERFVRLESSRTTQGSGLGLSLVSAVARLHRGVLSLGDGLGGTTDRPGLRAALVLPADS